MAQWQPRNFWITVAALAVAGGVGLLSLNHPVAGRRLFYFGLILGALLAAGALGEWAGSRLVVFSNPVLRAIQRTGLFVAEALAWLGVLLVGPAIRRALRDKGLSVCRRAGWTLSAQRGTDLGSIRAASIWQSASRLSFGFFGISSC